MLRCCRFLLVRSEDWVPCDFPYTGLSGYEPDPAYCYDTFAESLPNPIVYTIAQYTYVTIFLPFVLIFARRVILIFVDMKLLTCNIPFLLSNDAFTRRSRVVNSHDQCNIMCLLAVVLETARLAIDLEAWQGIIPPAIYRIMGRLVRSLVVTTAIVIFKIWMGLISFWTSKSTNR